MFNHWSSPWTFWNLLNLSNWTIIIENSIATFTCNLSVICWCWKWLGRRSWNLNEWIYFSEKNIHSGRFRGDTRNTSAGPFSQFLVVLRKRNRLTPRTWVGSSLSEKKATDLGFKKHSCKRGEEWSSGESRISCTETVKGRDTNLLFGQTFPKHYTKMKEIGPRGWDRKCEIHKDTTVRENHRNNVIFG